MQVSWYVRLTVRREHRESFRLLTEKMVEATREEEGALIYERFMNQAGDEIHIYERYSDSQAALAHLRSFKERFGERFSSLVERQQFTVFGNPNEELKALLDGFGATYTSPLAGFCKAKS